MVDSSVVTVRLPGDLGERLEQLADRTNRKKAFYVREALEAHLGELEWAYGVAARAEAIRAGVSEARPVSDLASELSFDVDELRAEGHATLGSDE